MSGSNKNMTSRVLNSNRLVRKSSNNINTSGLKNNIGVISQLSPEARKAMVMAREDVQENLPSPYLNLQTTSGTLDNETSNRTSAAVVKNNNVAKVTAWRESRKVSPVKNRTSTSHSSGSSQKLPPRYQKATQKLNANATRSRSNLSHPDPPFSISDNAESCNLTATASSASVYTTNNSYGRGGSRAHGHGNVNDNKTEQDYGGGDDNDEDDELGTLLINDDGGAEDEKGLKDSSFVLALDRALERNCISRLKGDITDTAQVSQPGTVRALDGGRLANAQEVVVNVCYDDDRQLVFHDDDEESLDTAKEISQIRVNIWMEYNSAFRPDDDFDAPSTQGEVLIPLEIKPSSPISMNKREKTFLDIRKLQSRQSSSSVKPRGLTERTNTTISGKTGTDSIKIVRKTVAGTKSLSAIPQNYVRSASISSSRGTSYSAGSSDKRTDKVVTRTRK